jgi:hypothetical protein
MFSLIVSFLFASSGYCATHTMFTTEKAVVTVQGSPRDADATELFNSINVPPFEEASAIKKKISIKSLNGEPMFDLSCGIAKNGSGYGSCMVTVFKSKFATLEPANNKVLFWAQANEAWPVIKNFVNPDADGKVFMSVDRRLGIFVYDRGMSFQIFFVP